MLIKIQSYLCRGASSAPGLAFCRHDHHRGQARIPGPAFWSTFEILRCIGRPVTNFGDVWLLRLSASASRLLLRADRATGWCARYSLALACAAEVVREGMVNEDVASGFASTLGVATSVAITCGAETLASGCVFE